MTGTDTAFTARFSPLTVATMVNNQTTLANYTPTASPVNTGLMSDIGRATVYGPDMFVNNFYNRFMKSPLSRGDATLIAKAGEVNSVAYDPAAADTALFNAPKPSFYTDVAKKNLSRQVKFEINDYVLKQYVQTQEMIGDVEAAIMAVSNACYLDDMWVASKAFFSGSTRSAKTGQLHTMTADVGDTGFADELNELIWTISQNQFGYKSTLYNPSGANTFSTNVHIALKKNCEYPGFKKLYAETFHPDFLKVAQSIDYVDDFATPAGAPSGAGELIGMIVDDRAWQITPMPDTLTTEAFRNQARKSTAFFTTYEYAFQAAPMMNVGYIFAPSE